jgi:hypothetical protein
MHYNADGLSSVKHKLEAFQIAHWQLTRAPCCGLMKHPFRL